ncbi:MAG: hypothetical protein IT303_16915 [Dehalococcoidia bacterium]|nr:hypothetical protein [Dehalococcoidia bacterium]
MSRGTSGLERDLNLIRRRAWLFIPFLLLGILVAVVFRSASGPSNAVASMQLETVVQDLVVGGDRGMRIFEAQSMTTDDRFKQMVRDEIGDPNFDYSRFSIALSPISVADGISRGVLILSIKDDDKVTAERYRAAWVKVFEREYQSPDGLFRTRFIGAKQDVVDRMDTLYAETVADTKQKFPDYPVDELVRTPAQRGSAIDEEYDRQIAQLERARAEINGAIASGSNAAVASLLLNTTVTDGNAAQALQARKATLDTAISQLEDKRDEFSDANLPRELADAVVNLRAISDLRQEDYVRLNNAKVAVTSAISDVETSYSFSGGVATSITGRIAIVIAITLVFGLIAIYGWEWLSQLRTAAIGGARDTA